MRIAVFTGPTGGHFFPALAFCEALKECHPETRILFVTSERARPLAEKARRSLEAQFEFLPDFPFPRPRRPNFVIRLSPFLVKLFRAFGRVNGILDRFRPELSMGFGSYVAFPGLWVSRRKKIPVIVHEQNWKMGRANAFLSRFATRVALSFHPGTACELPRSYQVTGLPLRRRLVESARGKKRSKTLIFPENRFRILIVGGSQGAHLLNQLWLTALVQFSDEEKFKVAVIHITGEKDFESVKATYRAKRIAAQVFPFHERMEEIYPEADLAVTRAGASTLFELALFGLPAVVIPYPHAEGHQEENARDFERAGGIRVLSEDTATPQELGETVREIIGSETRQQKMSESLRRLAVPDASLRLVRLAEELLRKKEACNV